MKLNKKRIALISMLLCLAMVLCSCKTATGSGKKKKKDKTSSNANTSDTVSQDDNWIDDDPGDLEEPEDPPIDDPEDPVEEEDDRLYATVGVDFSKPISQSYLNSALYLGWGYFPDNAGRTYTKKEIIAELDRLQKVGYTHVRTSLTSGWVTNSYLAAKQDWDWSGEEFQRFCWICKELEKRGVDLTMTLNWEMEADLKSNGIYVADNPAATAEKYAEYCYRLLKKLKENGVNNVKNLLPFVEPYPSKVSPVFPKLHSNEVWKITVSALDQRLKKEGMRANYKIMGPATSTFHLPSERLNALNFTGEDWAQWYINNCGSFIDIYAFHQYANYGESIYDDKYWNYYDELSAIAKVFKKTGKPVYIDEWGYSYKTVTETDEKTYPRYLVRNYEFHGTQRAAALVSILNAGADGSMLWSLFDTIFPNSTATNTAFEEGIQVTGTAPAINQTTVPYYNYYAMSMISKYLSVKTGTQVYPGIDDGDGVYLAATKQPDGTVTILVVNLNTEKTEVTFDLGKGLGGVTLYRHLYDPATVKRTTAAHIIGVDKGYKNVKTAFKDVLPRGAVAIYTTNPN